MTTRIEFDPGHSAPIAALGFGPASIHQILYGHPSWHTGIRFLDRCPRAAQAFHAEAHDAAPSSAPAASPRGRSPIPGPAHRSAWTSRATAVRDVPTDTPRGPGLFGYDITDPDAVAEALLSILA